MFWLDSRVLQSTRISNTVARGISQTDASAGGGLSAGLLSLADPHSEG